MMRGRSQENQAAGLTWARRKGVEFPTAGLPSLLDESISRSGDYFLTEFIVIMQLLLDK